MGNGFLKFKRYIVTETCVQSSLTAASSGIFLYALGLLMKKLDVLSLSPWILLSIAVGGALLAGGLYFLLHLPTDRRIAIRLDRQLGLAEKVQTYVEYQGQTGDVIQAQRRDAEEILTNTPIKKIQKRVGIVPLVLVAVSILALVGVLLVPTTESGGGNKDDEDLDPPFTLSSWQEQSLLDLIQLVKDSTMDETPKSVVIQELETLLATLKNTKKVSGMKLAVVDCIVRVSRTVQEHHTYLVIADLLKKSDHPSVVALGGAIGTLSLTTEGELNGIRDSLIGQETPGDVKVQLNGLYLALSQAMDTYKKSTSDPLYLTVMSYLAGLNLISQEMDDTSTPTEALTKLTSDTNTNMAIALMQQYVNEDVKKTVVDTLMRIFGISKNDLPEDVANNSSSGSSDGSGSSVPDLDKPLQGGGLAGGDIIYNSDDLVYDPETNSYVTYGTLLDAALGKFHELRNQGLLTDEEIKLINDYFDRLYSIEP